MEIDDFGVTAESRLADVLPLEANFVFTLGKTVTVSDFEVCFDVVGVGNGTFEVTSDTLFLLPCFLSLSSE